MPQQSPCNDYKYYDSIKNINTGDDNHINSNINCNLNDCTIIVTTGERNNYSRGHFNNCDSHYRGRSKQQQNMQQQNMQQGANNNNNYRDKVKSTTQVASNPRRLDEIITVYFQNDNGKIDNGKIDNGKIDHGKIDNGKIDNGKIDNGETDNLRIEKRKGQRRDNVKIMDTLLHNKINKEMDNAKESTERSTKQSTKDSTKDKHKG